MNYVLFTLFCFLYIHAEMDISYLFELTHSLEF